MSRIIFIYVSQKFKEYFSRAEKRLLILVENFLKLAPDSDMLPDFSV